ncbi:Thymocyte selection-associated high mobility group box protein TOX [Frankliniella fusca]|uniref:Thymocyte selection-associated high mobility group box protein TOX n=1 Tax=Frankliniella fusca TaxID=407009 RepID=A0AAE1HZU9_9NEOP|nr:Thymocyte selection-associated high mobility group box protein TOX [Frankliniella fusca]
MPPGPGPAAARGVGVVVCTLLLACAAGDAAPAQGQTRPSCHVQIGSAPPVPCGYIEHSDDALYLVSHDDGCGPAHECWEVSLGALGPLATLAPPAHQGAAFEVSVAHLPGPKAYNVSLTTSTVFRGSPGPGPGQASLRSVSTEDCRLLRGSTPVLDIIGEDAAVSLVPPGGALVDAEAFVPGASLEAEALALPPVCVTLHSDQCRVDCRHFTVPPHCRRTRFHQTVRCVEKPFASVLTFRNVTRLNISRFSSAPSSAPHVPLLFHCARDQCVPRRPKSIAEWQTELQLGGCVVATPTVAVPLYSVPVRAEVVVPGLWLSPVSAAALALASGGLLCIVVLLVVRLRWKGPGLPLLYPHAGPPAPGPGGALRASLSRLSLGAPPATKGGESVVVPDTRRILLVYCKDGSAAFSGAVRLLGRMLSASGRVEVMDMHEDPRLLEEGAVLRASTVLADEAMALVLVVTPALAETLRPTTSLLELDIFHKFVTSLVLAFSHAPHCAVARLFTVCNMKLYS